MTAEERLEACKSFRTNVLEQRDAARSKLASIIAQVESLGSVPTLSNLRTFLSTIRELVEDVR